MAEGKPIPGVHLVKAFDGPNPSRADEAMADDVVEILREGLRGGTDCDVGGVETDYATTRELEEAQRTERQFFEAIGKKLGERCGWADGRKGLACGDLGTRKGWRFGVYDRDGRLFEIEVTYSEIEEVARVQQAATLSNFDHTLNRIAGKFEEARRTYFARRDGVSLQ